MDRKTQHHNTTSPSVHLSDLNRAFLVLFGIGQTASKYMDKERNNYHEESEKKVLTILNVLNERVLTPKYKN